MARLNGVHAFGYNSAGKRFGWVHRLALARQILGVIGAEARARQRAEILFFFCQVSNVRFHRLPVGQISPNLHTIRGSVSRWILSGQFFKNFPVRGRFLSKRYFFWKTLQRLQRSLAHNCLTIYTVSATKRIWHYPPHLRHAATLPWEIKLQIFCRYWRKSKQIAYLIASSFVIHPQNLIFSVFKIANLSQYWSEIKFSMSLFFACLLWQSIICGIGNSSPQTSLQCLSTINMILSNEDKILIKSLYLMAYTAKRLTDEFPEKSWTKRGLNKLFKKLRDIGKVNRWTDSGGQRSACTEKKNAKLLRQKFPQSATDFVLPIAR